MSKVSIIIPVYNPPENCLKKCLDSIVEQSYNALDIILIDNGASNNCKNIMEKYAKNDNRINLIKFTKNIGFAGAVNAGIKLLKGNYILIVDSDDWLEKNAIKKLYETMKSKNCDLLLYCSNTYDEKLKIFTNEAFYDFCNIPAKYNNQNFSLKDIPDEILLSPSQAWNKFYKKDLIVQNNNFLDESLENICVDSLFSFNNYINAKEIGMCREKLYNYRINSEDGVVSSIMKKDNKLFLKPFDFAIKIDKLIMEKELSEKEILAFIKCNFYQLFYFFDIIHESNRKEYYNKMAILFNNLNSKIYTKSRINQLDQNLRKKINLIKKSSYIYYRIKHFIYRSYFVNGIEKRYICGLYIYKKKYANFKIYRRYLGFIHTEHEDFNARMDYIIKQTTENICAYIETKINN